MEMMMLNPFKIFSLAADARRANAMFGEHFGGATLEEKAHEAICLLEALRRDKYCLDAELTLARSSLADAHGKIQRMTSGLRRGSKQPA